MKVEDVLNDSWLVFKKHWVSFLIATGIVAFGSILTFLIAGPPLLFGLYFMAIKGLNGEEVEMADVFKGFNYFVNSWIYVIIAGILVTIGLILFLFPGLLLSILLFYAIPLIILKEMGATDGIQKSINIGRENFTFTILLCFTCFMINVVGFTLRIGWIVSIPFTTLLITKAAIDLTKE
ncbi:MAG: glycerophosphodiester phosphodiesterase [Candidatus Hydrothermarchaeales archaeon]